MSDLPTGWEWVRLDQIAEVRLGRQRSPKNHNGTHMRPYLRAANVGWDGLKLHDVKHMNFTDNEAVIYRLEPGDIVVSEASGSPGEVGKPALWRGEIDDCCFQNTLIRVRSYGADPSYLLHYLRSEALRGAFVEESRGVGINHLGAARLAAWPLPLPPLAEQRRIVTALEDHLSVTDVGIANLERASRSLPRLRRSTLVSVRREAIERGGEMRTIGQVAQTTLGKMLDSKRQQGEPTPYLRNINIRWGRVDLSDVLIFPMTPEERFRFDLQAGDLLICEGGEPGRCAIWRNETEIMSFQKALHRVRPGPTIFTEWLALMLEESTRNGRTSQLLTGSTIKHLPQEKLRSIPIPVPDLTVQQDLVQRMASSSAAVRAVANDIQIATRRSHSLRRSLLTTAFAGQLAPQDPESEPASALLARIRAERDITAKAKRTRHTNKKTAKTSPVQERLL